MCCGVGTEATLWEQLLSHLPADSGLMVIRPGWQILIEFKGEGTSQAPKDRKVGAAASWDLKQAALHAWQSNRAFPCLQEPFFMGFPRLALCRGKSSQCPASPLASGWSITLRAGKAMWVVLSPQLLPGAGGQAHPWSALSVPSWQWLSRCFRAWWRWAQRRRAVAAAVALGRRQLLRRGLRALRWALWLREAQLEAAWGRHTQALLARTFQKVRKLQIGAWRGDETPVCLGRRLSWSTGCSP